VNPQQPEIRRNEKGATDQDSHKIAAEVEGTGGGHAHGTDKGNKGGGKGGGVPPEQQSPYPS
jgi:hypothetical protein